MKIFFTAPGPLYWKLMHTSNLHFWSVKKEFNKLPSGRIFSVHSLSELGDVNEVSRNNLLFCHTYNIAMFQHRRSKPMHMVSVAINMYDSRMLLFLIIWASDDLLWWLLTNNYSYVHTWQLHWIRLSSIVAYSYCWYSTQ